jgi:hypothetical protein
MNENPSVKPEKSILKRVTSWLPILLAPVGVVAIIVYYQYLCGCFTGPDAAAVKFEKIQDISVFLEFIAPWLLVVATGLYWLKAIGARNPTYVVLTVLVGCLLLRELHWNPAIKKAIYPLLIICLVWALFWRDLMDKPSENPRHTIFLFCGIATYGLSQFFEKRLFRFLPWEGTLHSQFEETIEVAGHVLILLAAILGSWRKRPLKRTDRPG